MVDGSKFQPQSSILYPLSSILYTRWVFLRLLGLIYFIAFASLWVQLNGLIGSRGISPAADFLQAVYAQIGSEAYPLLPTLFWFNASDTALQLICGGGVLLSLLLVAGFAPGPILLLLDDAFLERWLPRRLFPPNARQPSNLIGRNRTWIERIRQIFFFFYPLDRNCEIFKSKREQKQVTYLLLLSFYYGFLRR